MRQSLESFLSANRKAFLFLGTVLCIGVFGIVAWQSSAQSQKDEAANNKEEIVGPFSDRAAAFAVTPKVSDLPSEKARMFDVDKYGNPAPNATRENPDMINPIVPGYGANAEIYEKTPFIDPLLANNPKEAPQVMPGPSLTFEGVSAANRQTIFGNRVMPPDTNGDVGPNHYISIVNGPVGIYNKNTGVLSVPQFRLSTLFAGLPASTGCSNRDDGDPVVLYDALADRWMLSQFGIPTGSTATGPWFECIAYSQTPDPTGAYFAYAFQTPTASGFPDYPKLGIWRDALYMSDHQNGFLAPPGAAGRGTGFFAFDRNKMLVGDPTATFIYFDRPTAGEGGIIPSDIDGITPPPANAPMLFFRYIADEFGAGFIDGVRPYQMVPDFVTPANSTLTVLPDIPVAAFDARQPTGRADIEQPAPALATQNLDSLNDRAMFRVAYSNVGTIAAPDNRYLVTWGVNTSGAPAGALTALTFNSGFRWTEIARDGAGALSIRDQGTHTSGSTDGATGNNIWMQHGAFDNDGNVAVGYSISSTTVNPSIRWAGRTGAAPAGTLNEGEATMFAGDGVQLVTNSRWGDYSSMSIDPTDGCTFYYHQEYRALASNNVAGGFDWTTRVGRFAYPGCTPVERGTLNVTVTNCQTGQPVPGAIVTAPGGYAQNTNASGVATFFMAPGTFNVTGTKNLFSVGNTTAVVTNGNTTNVTFCIQGAPLLATGGPPALTAESCLPANQAPDPGETITVNIPVTNNGGASTTNLVGTIQATGGVTNPSPASQNYGVIGIGATVIRPFTFTVDPALICGDTITITIAFQDGAANLGNLVYTIRTGVRPGAGTTTVSYTGPPVPVPDSPAPGVNINLPVAGIVGNLTDLDFRFDTAGACDATVGNTNAAMDHTFVGDLTFRLTPPDGSPTVAFMARRGGTRENICLTNLNDEGGFPNVSTITSVTGSPVAGDFTPEILAPPNGPLSLFDGENPNGTWVLNVQDLAGVDTGSMRRFSLIISSEGPSVCSTNCAGASADLSITKTDGVTQVSPGQPLTYTIVATNNTVGTTVTNATVTDTFPAAFTGATWTCSASAGSSCTVANGAGPINTTVTLAGGGSATFIVNGTVSGTATFGMSNTATVTPPAGVTDPVSGNNSARDTDAICPAAPTTTNGSNNTPAVISDGATATSTITIAGAGTYLTSLQATTFITHTFNGDLDMTLTSPAGTIVTLTSDNGGGNDNVFNGTIWNDTADPDGLPPHPSNGNPGLATDHTYVNATLASPLVPEEPFDAFRGENPNGTWTLRIFDDATGDTGSLASWNLGVNTLPAAPAVSAPTAFNNTTPAPIPDNAGFVTSTINVAGQTGVIEDVDALLNITHTFGSDIQAALTAPSGKIVTLTTNNGGGNDNVFAGTTFNSSQDPANQVPFPGNTFAASNLVTDTVYANLVTRTPLTPEESLGALRGDDPNGTWTLTVADVGPGDTGTVNSWGITIRTTAGGACSPTAAGVTVSGRVLTPDGYGLRNARVTIIDSSGVARTAITSSFGYYSFEGIEVGGTYVVSVASRRYTFTPRTVTVNDAVSDLNFVGQ